MLNITDNNFEEVLNSNKVVLVDFWMEGCPPCVLLLPILEELKETFKDKVVFTKLNLEEAPIVVQRYGVEVAPTVVLFIEGRPFSGFVGLKDSAGVKDWLKQSLLIYEYQEYAEDKGISLNTDKRIVDAITKGLLLKEEQFGAKYCPCRKITGDKKEDIKIICPCIYHLDEIKEGGKCLCGLFIKKVV